MVPPRKRWSLSMTESLTNPKRIQSTVHYARSMGACRIPIIQGTARNIIWTVLLKGLCRESMKCNPYIGSTLCKHNTSLMQLSAKTTKLEKSNRKLKIMNKRCTRNCDSDSNNSDHPQVMGAVTLGN